MEETLELVDISQLLSRLSEKAQLLGCDVCFTALRKVAFNTEMVIFVPPTRTMENVFAFSHEIGHLIDYLNGDLDYNLWKTDYNYRITAEMRAWSFSYSVLKEIDSPMDGWHEHAQKKLNTYFVNKEI